MRISPTAEGFRAAFRRPSFTIAEISWRWVTGGTATALFFYGIVEYLNTLPVTSGELLFLRSRQPYLIGQALAHIFRGSLARCLLALLLAAMLVSVFWMFTGAIGRIITVRAIIEYFRDKLPGVASPEDRQTETASARGPVLQSIVRLNFLRIMTAVAAVLGLVGAAILVSFVSTDAKPRPGLAFVLFVPLASMICLAWSSLNWLLSLAGMFAARDGSDAMRAISSAVTFFRERTGAVFAVSTWTGLAHLALFVVATSVVSFPMALAGLLPGRVVFLGVLLVTLAYFAVADWLYTARLAGYVCILETPEVLLRPEPPPMPTFTPPLQILAPVLQSSIDRDELILSDVPGPAPQTAVDRDEVILSDKPDLSS